MGCYNLDQAFFLFWSQNMSSQARLFLIDGHALAYRTYFALTRAAESYSSRFMTKSGEPTAGTYGFTSVLLRLLEEESPEYLAVSFDTGRTFRDDLYPEYKATRDKMPDDLRLQLERIRQLIDAFGIPILEAEGFEADDVLGTVARQAAEQDIHVVILTGDRDLLQLADENVVIRLAGQKLSEASDHGPEQVKARYGISPRQLIDFKAMIGDSSDNIPGVRGVGKVTATKLLQEYESLDAIYQNLDKVPTRFRNKLKAGKDEAYLSRVLGEIVTEVPITFDLEACRALGYDRDRVVELFRELEFRSLLNRIQKVDEDAHGQQLGLFVGQPSSVAIEEGAYQVVDNPQSLESLARQLADADQIAFDVETTSQYALRADLVGISLATEPEKAFYIPIGHNPLVAGGTQIELKTAREALQGPLMDADKPKIGHNLKYDFLVLARNGLRASPLTFDSMIAEWLCDPASRNLGLKNLAWVRLGVEMTEIEELIGRGRNQRSMAEIPISDVASYAAADAAVCLRLMPGLRTELEAKGQWSLFQDLEMPLVEILADMELSGVRLDASFLEELSSTMAGRLNEIETEIFSHVGHSFNVNSTQQLSKVLFEELKLQPPDGTRRTASGYYSTAASVLEALREKHQIVEHVLEHREIAKIKSTYADALPQQINLNTGRVHTSFNQTGSVTGRLASSDPNLQNIPIRTELGRRIRKAFVSKPDHVLLSVDYSQIELRIVAHMAEDQAMIQAFLADQDIHAATAAAVFEVSPSEITSQLRRRAKAVNFGLIYGMSPYGLTRATDLTLAEAENFVKTYFERFPGVERYLEQTKTQATQSGYVETLLGRRRYFPQLADSARVSEPARARAIREAINAPIQGTAADIIKIAMLRLPPAIEKAKLGATMLLQVHDELLFECPREELNPCTHLIQEIMESALELCVPLKTDAKAGDNWADTEPVN
jgi:DNA polymerase-1